jgi:hypothetical protein
LASPVRQQLAALLKFLFPLTILFWIVSTFASCDALQPSNDGTSLQNTTLIFKSSLDILKKVGFSINPNIDEKEIFNRWKEVLQYHSDPTDALYITLGDETPNKPYHNFSNDCWHFDLKAIERQGSYVRILENLKRISKGDLNFQNATDYCNDNEDKKAWVGFEFEGDKYKWDLKVDNDWADGYLFCRLPHFSLI